jgi:hypothetical protein
MKLRRVRWAGHVARVEEMRNIYLSLFGKPERKRSFGGLGHRWKGNIRMDLREIGWEGVDWMYLAQDGDKWRNLVNTVMDIRVP